MPKGIEVGVAVDTRAAKRGIETGLIEPLEDAQGALDDLGKSRGPDQLERGLEDAQDATERLKKETKETADTIEREYRASYRSASKSADDFARDASDDVGSFKQEAVQNLSEVASSWDGDLQGMADGVQGLTGGLASALTPGIGIPIAILGAAAGAFLQSWATASEATKQRVSDMFQDMADSGNAFLSKSFIDQSVYDLINDDAKRQKALDDAKRFGLDVGTVLRANAGDVAAINTLISTGNKLRQSEIDAIKGSGDNLQLQQDRIDGVNARYDTMLDTYVDINGEAQKAVDNVNLYREATGEAATADQTRYEAMARAISQVPTEVKTKVAVDTTDAERAISAFASRRVLDIKIRATDPYGRIY